MRILKRLSPQPAERTLQLLHGRWKAAILYQLMAGERRFSELQKRIVGISSKVLADQLSALEAQGLVSRRMTPQVPLRVDYQLTDLGRSLEPLLRALCAWGSEYARARNESEVRGCDANT